jgi:hypothetical protein
VSSADDSDLAGSERGTTSPESDASALGSKGRGERVFRIVAVALLLALVIGAAPGWYVFKGYRRARWADERGIKLVVKAEFAAFAPALRAGARAPLGRHPLDRDSYELLRKPGYLKAEAGGDFWSGFYGLGTQLYHHTVGNRIGTPLSAKRLEEERHRALKQQARKTTATAARCERLVGLLGHSDFRKREAATEEIRRLGPATVPYLRKAADSPDPEVADRAGRLLKELSHQRPGTTPQ